MALIDVKFFSSRKSGGAASLSGTTSSLNAILRQCLVTGFNSKVVTAINVVGNVATADCTAHGFTQGDVIDLAGANEAFFVGEWRVNPSPTTNQFTFQVPGGAPASATGVITVKYASLGWTEEFTNGSTKAVFRNTTAGGGTGYRLRSLDDGSITGSRAAGAKAAQWQMIETAYSVDTYDRAQAVILQKSQTSDATTRHWFLVGDKSRFYLGIEWSGSYPACSYLYGFGDLKSYRAGDASQCFIAGVSGQYGADSDDPGTETYNTTEKMSYFDGSVGIDFTYGRPTGMFVGKPYFQFGTFTQACALYPGATGLNRMRNGSAYYDCPPGCGWNVYPNPVDNAMMLTGPLLCGEITNVAVRGRFPGIYLPLQQIRPANSYFPGVLLDSGLTRDIWVAQMGNTRYSLRGELAFDITGPWS